MAQASVRPTRHHLTREVDHGVVGRPTHTRHWVGKNRGLYTAVGGWAKKERHLQKP